MNNSLMIQLGHDAKGYDLIAREIMKAVAKEELRTHSVKKVRHIGDARVRGF